VRNRKAHYHEVSHDVQSAGRDVDCISVSTSSLDRCVPVVSKRSTEEERLKYNAHCPHNEDAYCDISGNAEASGRAKNAHIEGDDGRLDETQSNSIQGLKRKNELSGVSISYREEAGFW